MLEIYRKYWKYTENIGNIQKIEELYNRAEVHSFNTSKGDESDV